jgi:hypothetical protein
VGFPVFPVILYMCIIITVCMIKVNPVVITHFGKLFVCLFTCVASVSGAMVFLCVFCWRVTND